MQTNITIRYEQLKTIYQTKNFILKLRKRNLESQSAKELLITHLDNSNIWKVFSYERWEQNRRDGNIVNDRV